MIKQRSPIRVGVAGWSYPDWAGVVYPGKRARGGLSELAYLARYLDAIEINTTFYHPPASEISAKWVAQVADRPEFLFTAKLWQRFTHAREQPWTRAEARMFSDGIEPLREAGRLGALLMQFPWSFKPAEAERDWLARLAEQFSRFPCVVEVRHCDWNTPENLEFFRALGLGFCNIDQPRLGGNLPATNLVTGPAGYYRFHGRNAKAWFSASPQFRGGHSERSEVSFPRRTPSCMQPLRFAQGDRLAGAILPLETEGMRRSAHAGRDERYNYLYSEKELAPWVEQIGAAAAEGKAQQMFVIANNHYKGQAVVNALEVKSRLSGKLVPVPGPLLEAYPALEEYAARTGLF